MITIDGILKEIRDNSVSQKDKGSTFERIIKRWLLTDPRYNFLEKVWLWDEFPGKDDLGGIDLGIDLVALTDTGDYWAIQCKCYAEDAVIDKTAVNSFLANASRRFTVEGAEEEKDFSNLVWVDTTLKDWSKNAEEALRGLSKPFNRISLNELENSAVDWDKIFHGSEGKDAQLSRKRPLEHQKVAIEKAHKYYVDGECERGKLIMACGTGKTYTSLRIMEDITEKKALILVLVPSIALLGQTLNAWMADKEDDIKAICVCSDSKVNRKMKEADEEDESVVDLAVPASTDVGKILELIRRYAEEDCRTVFFSTYQSIDVVSEVLHKAGRTVDLCICDEAHRTAGVKISGQDESYFTKVHSDDSIPARKRLYMTATPRLYRESAKVKAVENDDVLCSMDDEKWYGKEFYRLTFNDAVSKGLLTDYKVLVLTVDENKIPEDISRDIAKKYAKAEGKDKLKELNFDDATKIIGCINVLSKRIIGDGGVTRQQDPVKMKRAVAFCQTINPTKNNPNASSTQIATYFNSVCEAYKKSLPEEERTDVVDVKAQHIDGSMDANTRNQKLAWLKEASGNPSECRVLCNVRCLSEGVDVPSLDAVLFLSPRNSEVEVVQSVGRVMRNFGKGTDKEKKYGYIIIPVIVPEDIDPEDALDNNEKFKVVWTILNALRSHDENFNAHINQINLNKKRDPKVIVGTIPSPIGQYSIGNNAQELEKTFSPGNDEIARMLEMRFGTLQEGIYARIVDKVGDRMYWENWSKEIGQIAKKFIGRITRLVEEKPGARRSFEAYLKRLQKNINPSVDRTQGIEMLAQHMITKPIFDALFRDYEFVKDNAVSRSMQQMILILKKEGFEMDTEVLDKFYTSVKNNVSGIDNLEGKQTIIKNIYEKFFKGTFPTTVEKLGIVYTPVECVDFIIKSVDAILRKEFNTSLTQNNVHILDPFTGTGTFITRLLQIGVIKPDDMRRKYRDEIHCNEIVLLAYYIADVNIEAVYQDIMRPASYEPFEGICLADTFQMMENVSYTADPDTKFDENYQRQLRQSKVPVRVILGNPPYSVGQKNANDNARNVKYDYLDKQIANTYVAASKANNKNSLYDSYIRAFRWASDRIESNSEGGIVAFISNGSWIDGNAQDGMRYCLEQEFDSIYVLNLRGNQRTSGELSRKEGGKIFGSGSRTPIAITFLVKSPSKKHGNATIYYHDIGDYLTREDKLRRIKNFKDIDSIDWTVITPTNKNDWINQRDGVFDNLIPLFPAKKFSDYNQSFFSGNSNGVKTQRDSWAYGFSVKEVSSIGEESIGIYNSTLKEISAGVLQEPDYNTHAISWTSAVLGDLRRRKEYSFDDYEIREVQYRPYFKQNLFWYKSLIERTYTIPSLFPDSFHKNLVICASGTGVNKPFSCLISDCIVDLEYVGKTQCFPLYWYEKNYGEYEENKKATLFDENGLDAHYVRKDGITDWILQQARQRYHAKNITKEHIFYYVYGILHSKDYRTRFATDLRKSLPRIPFVEKVEDFMDFYKAGKKLADLHLNYETVEPYKAVVVSGDKPLEGNESDYNYYKIPDKMRFKSKADKSTIYFNGHITISNIPEKAYEYVVNGKSAIEWIMERYCVSVDRASQIKNDCNDWAREHSKPRYILDLLLSVINLSVQSVDIIDSLPKLDLG